jgi:hypothetical protein
MNLRVESITNSASSVIYDKILFGLPSIQHTLTLSTSVSYRPYIDDLTLCFVDESSNYYKAVVTDYYGEDLGERTEGA